MSKIYVGLDGLDSYYAYCYCDNFEYGHKLTNFSFASTSESEQRVARVWLEMLGHFLRAETLNTYSPW